MYAYIWIYISIFMYILHIHINPYLYTSDFLSVSWMYNIPLSKREERIFPSISPAVYPVNFTQATFACTILSSLKMVTGKRLEVIGVKGLGG
jgi:hypothetical protein